MPLMGSISMRGIAPDNDMVNILFSFLPYYTASKHQFCFCQHCHDTTLKYVVILMDLFIQWVTGTCLLCYCFLRHYRNPWDFTYLHPWLDLQSSAMDYSSRRLPLRNSLPDLAKWRFPFNTSAEFQHILPRFVGMSVLCMFFLQKGSF